MAVKFPDVLESNNTDEYGIVRANQVMGHKTVPTLNDLYQIKHFILSDSGNNTNNDAIGQRWYVVDLNKYYQLKDWSKRNQKEGWEEASSNSAELYIIKKDEWLLNDTDLYKGNFTGYLDDRSPYTAEQYSIAYNNARNLSLALQYAVDKGYKKIRLETGKYALPTVYSIIVTEMKNVDIDLGGSTLYTIKEAYRTFSLVISNTAVNKDTGFTNALYEGGTMFIVSNSSNSVIRNATFIGDRNYLDWRNKRASSAVVNAALGDPGNTVGILLFGDKLRVENITFKEIRGEAVWTGINEDRRRINATLLDGGTYDYKGSISLEVLTSALKNSNGYYFIGSSLILNIGNVTVTHGNDPDLSNTDLIYLGTRHSYNVSSNFIQEINSSSSRSGKAVIPSKLLENSTISDLLNVESYREKLRLKLDKTLLEKLDKGIFEIHSWGYVYGAKNDTYRYRREPRASGENLIILTYQHPDDDSNHNILNYTRAIRTSFGLLFQLNPWEKYVRVITLNDFYIDDSGNTVTATSEKSIFSIIIALNRNQRISNCEFINCFRGGIGVGSHNVIIDNCRFLKDASINRTDSVSESIYFQNDGSASTYSPDGDNAMITTEGFQPCNLEILNSYFNASNGQSQCIFLAHDVKIENCITHNITFWFYWTIGVSLSRCKIYDGCSNESEYVSLAIGQDNNYNKLSFEFYNLNRRININNNNIYCGNTIFRFRDNHNCFIDVYNNTFLVARLLHTGFLPTTYNYWKNNSFHDNLVVIMTNFGINDQESYTKLGESNINIVFNADCYNNHFICNRGIIKITSPRFKNNITTGRVSLYPRLLRDNISEVIVSDSQVEDIRFFIPFKSSDLDSKTIIFDNCDISNLRLDTYATSLDTLKIPTIIFKNCYIKTSITFPWLKTSNNGISPLHLKFFNCVYGNLTDNYLIRCNAAGNILGTDQDTIEYDYSMPEIKLINMNFSSVMNTSTIIGSKSGTSFPSFPYEGMLFYKTDVSTYYVYGNNKWNLIGDNIITEDGSSITQINATLDEIKAEQTEQNSTLADHENRLVYTESDLLKVREEYNGIISDLLKSIRSTQKAFVVETNDSEGVIYIDNVKTIIPPNSRKGFIFQNRFEGGGSGIKSFRFLITNTSGFISMHTLFSGCSSLTSLDLSSFDTSKVTAMSYMFSGCSALTSIDISSFDTSAVTNMSAMFNGCKSLTSIDLSSFDTSAVTDMNAMFSGCSALTSVDLSNFDTSSVAGMVSMFNNCHSLTSVDLSNFETSAATTMSSMFKGCSSLTSLDLSNFDTRAVTTMDDMFRECASLTHINVSNFDTTGVKRMRVMFGSCASLTSLDLSNFDTSAVTIMDFMFQNCPSLTNLLLGQNFFKTSAVTIIDFSDCSKWTNETVVTSLVTNSYDRAAAGLNTLTIKLHANTKAALTDEQKATITNKGYTIA